MRSGLTIVVALAVGTFTLARARHDPGGSFGGTSTAGALAELAGGWSLVAAGVLLSTRRRTHVGALFAIGGLLWFAREWSNPALGGAVSFTAGNVLFVACVPFVAHAALAYPSGRLRGRATAGAVAAAYLGGVGLLGLLPMTVFDPQRVGCADCPRNLLLVHADAGLYDSLNRWGLRAGIGWLALLVAAALWKLSRQRRSAAATFAVMTYLVAVGFELSHGLSSGVLGSDPGAIAIWRVESACLVGVFAGVAWSLRRERRARTAVARLVLELADAPAAGNVERLLREELGDASLTLAYRRRDRNGYVDAAGSPVTPAPSPTQVETPLRRGNEDVGVLVHDERLLERPGLLTEAVAAAALALANEQLRAEVRAQLTELAASRARIVAAGDAQRQRLERGLHDGAQQRLVGLLIALQLLRAELGDADRETAVAVEDIRMHVNEALDELREIAHGLYPAVLADDGLQSALEMVSDRSSGRVRTGPVVAQRLPRVIENTAFFAASEAVSDSPRATVSVVLRQSELVVEVQREDASPLGNDAVQEITDRVGAVGGRVSAHGSTLRAEIPCAS